MKKVILQGIRNSNQSLEFLPFDTSVLDRNFYILRRKKFLRQKFKTSNLVT